MPAPTAVTAPVTGRDLRAWLGRRRRLRSTSPWYRLYLAALLGLPALAIVTLVEPPPAGHSDQVLAAVGRWLPLVLAGLLVAAARLGTWAGVVVPERGEVAWIFSAPVSRASLLRGRVVRGLALAGASGAVVAWFAGLLLVVETDRGPTEVLPGTVVAGGLLGVVAGSVVWWTQSSEARARAVLRGTPWALLGLVLLAGGLARWPSGLEPVLGWSGPWGWAGQLGVSGAGGGPAWLLALALTVAAAAGAAIWSVLTADRIPLAELARRADAVSGVRAAMFFLDLRQAAELRRGAQRRLDHGRALRVRPPSRPSLAVAWSDLLELVRSPGWAVTGAATVTAVALAHGSGAATRATEPMVVPLVIGVVGGASSAVQLVAPLRTEASYPVAERHLPWRATRVAWLHLVTPTVLLAAVVALAWGGAWAGGLPGEVVGPGLGFSLLAVPPVLLAVALGATLPPPSLDLLLMGEAGAAAFGTRVLIGPQLVALVAAPAVVVLLAEPRPARTELWVLATVWSALASAGLAAWLRHQIRLADRDRG